MTPPWSLSSIRLRLTAWYVGVMAVMLVIYAAATYFAVRHEFSEQAGISDEQVAEQSGEVLTVLVLGVPLIVVLAGIGGSLLARRALGPVETSFEQLRRFTADASHELRTPLSVMRSSGEHVLAQPRTVAEYRDTVGSMLEEVDRMTRLVESLLKLARGDAGRAVLTKRPTNLGELAGEVVSSLTILADERQQRLELRLDRAAWASADPLLIREAMANLIDNAIKYSPRGTTVDVEVGARDGVASFTVADQGPGIPDKHQSRVFDRFYRADESRSREEGGTGLGLAIAKWAVEANGGTIRILRSDRGAVFQISLPLTKESVSMAPPTEKTES